MRLTLKVNAGIDGQLSNQDKNENCERVRKAHLPGIIWKRIDSK